MTPEQIEADIRRFVARCAALPLAERIDHPLFIAYAQGKYLLRIIDELRATLAHTPSRATRVVTILPVDAVPPRASPVKPPREPPHFHGGTAT